MEERDRGIQPLDEGTTALRVTFDVTGPMYQPLSALAILAALNAQAFSGTCECYLQPESVDGLYEMGVALDLQDPIAVEEWWKAFLDNVAAASGDDEEIRLNQAKCEFVTLAELRCRMLHAGTAGFEGGWTIWISAPLGPDADSPFTALCRDAR